jgi:hypothetical protein
VAARGQAVEVLEDVAVSAADARALGRVGDPQAPIARARRASGRVVDGRVVLLRRGCGSDRARVEELRPALPEQPLGVQLAFALVGAARDRLVVHEPRGGEVEHAEAGLPRAQAPVDVLESHRVTLVEQADALDHRAADIHARTGDRERRARAPGRTPVGGLEAVAVVEPLRRVAVAHRPAELDAPIGVLQLRADDAGVGVAVGRVLQALQPAGQRLDVGVQHTHIALAVAGPQAAVDVRGEAGVALAGD